MRFGCAAPMPSASAPMQSGVRDSMTGQCARLDGVHLGSGAPVAESPQGTETRGPELDLVDIFLGR